MSSTQANSSLGLSEISPTSKSADTSRLGLVATGTEVSVEPSAAGDGGFEPSDSRGKVAGGEGDIDAPPPPEDEPPPMRRAFSEPIPSLLTSGIPHFMVKRAAYLVGASEDAQRYERLRKDFFFQQFHTSKTKSDR